MKCKKCGNEVKAGSLFCPNCGKEIQIVPDYNAYEEEEYLQQLMSEENQKQKTAALPQIKKKNNWLLIILTIAVALVLVVFLIVFLAMRKKEEQANSFDYQYQQGIEAQINAVDRETLEDALIHPENHGDLIVRIGGYSDYFVRLTPTLKAEVIARTEY